MIDTGSEVTMVGQKIFESLGGKLSDLDKSETFSIASTTQVRDNCVIGTIWCNLYLPINPRRKSENEVNFGRTWVKLLVGSNDLDMKEKFLIGTPMLHQTKAEIFSTGNRF